MTLNEWLARTKAALYEEISQGRSPSVGTYDQVRLSDLQAKGEPQMGTTTLEPQRASFEFIFRLTDGQSQVLTIDVVPPERIVFMPVPEWVVESVWEGEVVGSHHFESHAQTLFAKYGSLLTSEENARHFDEHKAIGRH